MPLIDPETKLVVWDFFIHKLRRLFYVETLRQKVKEDGVVIGEKILKVDGF